MQRRDSQTLKPRLMNAPARGGRRHALRRGAVPFPGRPAAPPAGPAPGPLFPILVLVQEWSALGRCR
jgi:hypothetical protein